MNKLKIAVSQFPVTTDIKKNRNYIRRHIIKATKQKSDIIHFPETALSGYDSDMKILDWNLLHSCIEEIKIYAREFNLFIVLGSHKKQMNKKPFNVLYVISNEGEIIGTYIKNHLYHSEIENFDTKKNLLVVEIKGILCGFLICYDSCFPDLFHKYRKKGVKVLFLSYYNANSSNPKKSLDNLMKAQIATRAADNFVYISGSNSSSKYSRIPSCIVSPDGQLTSLKRHVPDVLIYDYPCNSIGWTYSNSIKGTT